MARPHRIEFAQAVYHVTARGDRQEAIFLDDQDRLLFLDLLAQALERFDACALAYCLMDNHYHLVLCTRQPNLSALMRHVNGVFTQRVNRRHGKVGHVFQGRYKAILVDRDAYLLEVCRYVDLNPVRAGMVASPQDWPWSSYRALTGARQTPPWLDAATVHGMLLGRTPASPAEQQQAAAPVCRPGGHGARRAVVGRCLAAAGLSGRRGLRRTHAGPRRRRALSARRSAAAAPLPQPQPLREWLASCSTREEALYRAYREGGLTMTAMARELGLSVARVSQLVQRGGIGDGWGGWGQVLRV